LFTEHDPRLGGDKLFSTSRVNGATCLKGGAGRVDCRRRFDFENNRTQASPAGAPPDSARLLDLRRLPQFRWYSQR
jgi:hypothetical protein